MAASSKYSQINGIYLFPNKWDSSWLCHWVTEVQPERSWRNSWALGALLCARITALLLLWKTKRSAVEGSFSRRVLFRAFPPLISTRRSEVTGELSRNYTAIHRQFYQQILIQPLGWRFSAGSCRNIIFVYFKDEGYFYFLSVFMQNNNPHHFAGSLS